MLCRQTATSWVASAPAKLNLFLRVVGKRADGYHDIETVMTAVDLYDTLVLAPSPRNEIDLTVRMAVSEGGRGEIASPIPIGPENLVYRAAALLKQHCQISQGVDITLVKRIPSAAGLGGGSSDAAAALGALNAIWGCGLNSVELRDLASQLGSDVPFFLGDTTSAVCRGRGEILEPLAAKSGLTFVVAKPRSGLSTPAVYHACRPKPADEKLSQLIDALTTGRSSRTAQHLRNDLQSPAEQLNRDVIHLACLFSEQGLAGHQLSGSGTAYFGMCHSRSQALSIAARLRQRGVPWVRVVQNRC
jgi:4-diphosphocytidyl-2-C-methyl-D-erythritol kinase